MKKTRSLYNTELCRNCKKGLDKHEWIEIEGVVYDFQCKKKNSMYAPMNNLQLVEHYAKERKRKYPKEDIMMLASCGLSNLEIIQYVAEYP